MTANDKVKNVFQKTYLVFPKKQLKYALVYSFILFVTMAGFISVEYYFLSNGEHYGLDQRALMDLRDSLFTYNVFLLIISLLVTFMTTILVTHRFLGPIVSIRKKLERFKTDKKYTKIEIRKTDEIQPLVDSLNDFLSTIDDEK
jgi:methyl-accepting chemotaxis protein